MTDPHELCHRLTLPQRIGQCLMPAVGGQYSAVGERAFDLAGHLAVQHEVGGFCMFDGTIFETPLLLNALQDMSAQPLLIAADLEAGAGRHLAGATEFPNAMAVGATGDRAEEHARAMGRITAYEARSCGVHLLFAPVADCNLNPENPIVNTRAFGDDPEWVGACAAAFIRGCAEGGAAATLKHFPGHGTTKADSHAELPTLEFDRATWEQAEGRAFRAALAARPAAVMMGHLQWPALDPEWPCSLSPAVVGGLLRRECGFDGVVCTDALMMGAVASRWDEGTAAVQALQAGVDLLLYPKDAERVAGAVLAAVTSGALPESAIDAAATRVLRLKERLGLFRDRRVEVMTIEERAYDPSHREAAAAIAREASTLVRDSGVPARFRVDRSGTAVWCMLDDPHASRGDVFVRALRDRVPPCEVERVTPETAAVTIAELHARRLKPARLIVALFGRVRAWKGRVGLDPRLREAVIAAAAMIPDTMAVSFGSPYLVRELPSVPTFALAYSDDPASQAHAALAVLDALPATGRSPVRLDVLAE